MRILPKLLAFSLGLIMAIGIAGCTVYPEKKFATLDTTTSAQQHERLYWEYVRKQDWKQVTALQGPSVVYTTRTGELVDGVRWIQLLQGSPIGEYSIGAVQVRPQEATWR